VSPAGDKTALKSETPPTSRALGDITRLLAAIEDGAQLRSGGSQAG